MMCALKYLFIAFLATLSKGKFVFVWGGQDGELPELAGFSLYLGSRKLVIKGKQNDWAVPRLDLSVCLIQVCDKAMACV